MVSAPMAPASVNKAGTESEDNHVYDNDVDDDDDHRQRWDGWIQGWYHLIYTDVTPPASRVQIFTKNLVSYEKSDFSLSETRKAYIGAKNPHYGSYIGYQGQGSGVII